jgi:hypothetical protein
MRVLLVVAILQGLVPGLGELVESAVHSARTGHLPHTAGETDLGHPGPEHSCGVTLHACGCCVSQAFVLGGAIASVERGTPARACPRTDARHLVRRAPARPFRPPIA